MFKAITTNSSPPTPAPSRPATEPSPAPPDGPHDAPGRKPFFVTTSWDDGSPLDFRVAELLARYGLPGTFYLPRASQRPTMGDGDVKRLAETFDVGGHTLDHLALTELSPEEARRQIEGSKRWLEDLTGRPCTSFCPPLGRFRRQHLALIRDAGFCAARTVELLSLDRPRPVGGLAVLPTTVQAYPHRGPAYLKNALRRGAAGNAWRYLRHGKPGDWVGTCRALLDVAGRRGGVFHLWGHSWEIDEAGQWQNLEEALRLLGAAAGRAVSNSELAATELARDF